MRGMNRSPRHEVHTQLQGVLDRLRKGDKLQSNWGIHIDQNVDVTIVTPLSSGIGSKQGEPPKRKVAFQLRFVPR